MEAIDQVQDFSFQGIAGNTTEYRSKDFLHAGISSQYAPSSRPRLRGRSVSKREPAVYLALQHVDSQLPSSCRHVSGMLPISLIELGTLYLHMSEVLSLLDSYASRMRLGTKQRKAASGLKLTGSLTVGYNFNKIERRKK